METITISKSEYDYFLSCISIIDTLKKDMEVLIQQNAQQQEQISRLTSIIKLSYKKIYGSSSEKTPCKDQLLLFDEPEGIKAADPVPVPDENCAARRNPRKGKRNEQSLQKAIDSLPVSKTYERKLKESERVCPHCGDIMQHSGSETRRFIKLLPAVASVIAEILPIYKCKNCEKHGTADYLKKAPSEIAPYPKCIADPGSIAHIIAQKTVMSLPLYRQEQEWSGKGLPLSRQTMFNWIKGCDERYFSPIVEVLRGMLIENDILHADETPLQVLHEEGKSPKSKGYVWLYRTGCHAEMPIVIYDYQKGRGSEYPAKFLNGFRGYLHTDGYAAYKNLSQDIHIVGCWAHARRKFCDACTVLSKESDSGKEALRGRQYIDKMFGLERELQDLPPDSRQKRRGKELKEKIDEFFSWAESLSMRVGNNALGTAIAYCLNQRKYLESVLKDSRLELSNNLAERSIKPFVIGRKNFLFSNTANGARISANLYSLTETAKELGLDPELYFQWVLEQAPKLSNSAENWAAMLIPHKAPPECRAVIIEIT